MVAGKDAFERWLSGIEPFPESMLDGIMAAIRSQWATPEELAGLQDAILAP